MATKKSDRNSDENTARMSRLMRKKGSYGRIVSQMPADQRKQTHDGERRWAAKSVCQKLKELGK